MSDRESSPEAPALPDSTGYRPTERDLAFVGVTPESYLACAARDRPLGMSVEAYRLFVKELLRALAREGIHTADIRIQGSSVKFFSSPFKRMPYERSEVFAAFLDAAGSPPAQLTLDQTRERIQGQWPEEPRPYQRPFDSFHTLGIDDLPSDIDVQISSDEAIDVLRTDLADQDIDWADIANTNPRYRFIRKELSQQLLYVERWTAQWQGLLGRGVSVALFPSTGPDRIEDEPDDHSSHFKASDWIVHTGSIEPRR